MSSDRYQQGLARHPMESTAASGESTIVVSSSVGECVTVQARPRGLALRPGVMTGRRSGNGTGPGVVQSGPGGGNRRAEDDEQGMEGALAEPAPRADRCLRGLFQAVRHSTGHKPHRGR